MSELTLEHIKKTFEYFERMGFKRPTLTIEDDELSESEWFELFNYVSAEVFKKACLLVVKQVSFWPKPSDFMKAVDEVHAEMRFKPAGALPEPPKKKTAFSDFLARNPEVAQNSPFAIEFLKKRAGVS